MTNLPKSVVETDHKLEGQATRASEDLARHRWHWTLDETNAKRVTPTEYAREVGRSQSVIRTCAKGWAIYQERLAKGPAFNLDGFTIEDAIRLAGTSVERREFAEAIAEGSGRSVGAVSRGDARARTDVIISQARQRAERKGTSPVDEARDIARHQRRSQEMDAADRERKRRSNTMRYVEVEGKLARAKQFLTEVLQVAEGVDFDDEEQTLIRASIENIRALLTLIDLRMAGTPDVDWDAELERLSQ